MRYGKSYKQWLKEVQNAIHKRGFSIPYSNAQAICVRLCYGHKHNYDKPEDAAKYALRNVWWQIPKKKKTKHRHRTYKEVVV